MTQPLDAGVNDQQIPVIDLSLAPGRRAAWDRPRWCVYLWTITELLLVSNPWQPSSSLRRAALKVFGASIGAGVVLRPRLRVKFPWKLEIGARSWIGEDVWIHNQAHLSIGSDAVVSQGCFVTTGTHAYRGDMSLITRPVTLEDGVWITARCIVLSGSVLRRSALILPGTVVQGEVPPGAIYGGNPGQVTGNRFASRGS